MLVVAGSRLQARPELPSFVLLAWVLRLFDRFARTPDRRIYAIAGLQLVWVNVHGLFAAGIGVCAIELAGELLRALGRAGEPLRTDRVRRLAAVTLLAALVSVANPNGLEGALYPLGQLDLVSSAERRGVLGASIDELRPIFSVQSPIVLGLFLALAGLSLGAIAANWKRVREADLLLWVAFFYLAIGAMRNTALFAVVAAPTLVRNANEALGARLASARAREIGAALATGLALFVALDAARGRWFSRTGRATELGLGIAEGINPIGAAEWIARARPPAPIAHGMGDGGYLIWRLWPEYAVMSDGRLEVFGPDLLPRLQPLDAARFAELDAKYHFGTVLLNHRRNPIGPLAGELQASGAWRLTYADDVSVVFVRGDADPLRWPELDLGARGVFEPLDGVGEAATRQRLLARVKLLLDLRRPDLALHRYEDALASHPELPNSAQILARLRPLAEGASAAGAAPDAGDLATPPPP